MISDLSNQFGYGAQWVKAVCIALMNFVNSNSRVTVLQRRANLFTGHVILMFVILVHIYIQCTEWLRGYYGHRIVSIHFVLLLYIFYIFIFLEELFYQTSTIVYHSLSLDAEIYTLSSISVIAGSYPVPAYIF